MKNFITIYFSLFVTACFSQNNAAKMVVQSGHFDEITSMEFSPNGKWLASGSRDRSVILYDVKTGLQMATLRGLKDWALHVEFTADNKNVIALSNYSANNWSGIIMWDVLSSDTVFSVKKPSCGHIQSFKQCAAANRLIVMVEGLGCLQFQIHDLKTGKKLKEFKFDQTATEHWAVSSDAKTIVFEDKKTANVNILNVETGIIIGNYHVTELENVNTSKSDVVYVSDDNKFYCRSFGLRKWFKMNLATGEIIRSTYDDVKNGTPDRVHMNSAKSLIYANYGSNICTYSMPEIKLLEKIELSDPSYAMVSAACHNKNMIAFNYNQHIYFYDLKHKRVIRKFEGSSGKPLQAIFSNDSRTIAIADYYSPLKIWDLQSADAVKTVEKVDLNSDRFHLMQFSPDDKVLFTFGNNPRLVHIPTLEHKNYAEHFYINLERDYYHRQGGHMTVSNDFTKIIKGNNQFDLFTGRSLCKYEAEDHSGDLFFTFDGKYAYEYTHSYERDSIKIFIHNTSDCSQRIIYKIPDDYKRGYVAVSRDGKKIAVAGTGISVSDFLTGKVQRYYTGDDMTRINKKFTPDFDCSALDFSPDGNSLVVADNTTNTIGIISVETGKVIHILKGHNDKIYTVAYSPDGLKIVSVSEDKTVKVWNALTGVLDITFVPSGETDYVMYTPDNYYMCSKKGLKAVAYRVKNKMFRAEQFDLRQNRPDTVLQRLGYATNFSIKMYKKAWHKRLQKTGFTPDMLGSDYDIPVVEIQKPDEIPLSTGERIISFDFNISDSLHKLSRYNVYVNDVPLYGIKGIDLFSRSTKNSTHHVDMELAKGRNFVQVTAFNEKGTESIRESFEVYSNRADEKKPDLYILAIGVSSYKDKARDLKFAAKDAGDLTAFFKNNSRSFDSVHVKLISGKDAILDNVLAAKLFLTGAEIADHVILYFSGHGLLNEDLNYYLAMYDVDFNKPESGGLAYEEFEGLLEHVKSRNRLILVDACHSGELDKDETVILTSSAATQVTGGFRSGGAIVKPKVGLKNSLALMRELFNDTQKGSGATIISAAGGMEYALESADWNNGVFTYAILDGLKNNHADYDFDKLISVSELRLFVSDKVYQLTRGAQLPTARRENTENNFIVK